MFAQPGMIVALLKKSPTDPTRFIEKPTTPHPKQQAVQKHLALSVCSRIIGVICRCSGGSTKPRAAEARMARRQGVGHSCAANGGAFLGVGTPLFRGFKVNRKENTRSPKKKTPPNTHQGCLCQDQGILSMREPSMPAGKHPPPRRRTPSPLNTVKPSTECSSTPSLGDLKGVPTNGFQDAKLSCDASWNTTFLEHMIRTGDNTLKFTVATSALEWHLHSSALIPQSHCL